jgi:hypothetical protein
MAVAFAPQAASAKDAITSMLNRANNFLFILLSYNNLFLDGSSDICTELKVYRLAQSPPFKKT